MYTQRKEPYKPDANDIVANDDILTLWAFQTIENQTLTDEGLAALGKIARKIAPDHVLTLYARQHELRRRMERIEQMQSKGGKQKCKQTLSEVLYHG